MLNKIAELPFKSISIGFRVLNFASADTFKEYQTGYRLDDKGQNLCSEEEGAWKESWYVIASDDLGDPIFFDLSDGKVYTAMNGVDSWDPSCIADNFEDYKKAVLKLREISEGRDTPDALENNPIDNKIKDELEAIFDNVDNEAESWYWLNILED